jgi:hypothetical protein
MRFFVSNYADNKSGGTTVLYITNEVQDRSELLGTLRDCFGPWMFLGIREYNKTQFLQQFSTYVPERVVEHINSPPSAFTYKAEIYINNS